jgi:hypothetical protein
MGLSRRNVVSARNVGLASKTEAALKAPQSMLFDLGNSVAIVDRGEVYLEVLNSLPSWEMPESELHVQVPPRYLMDMYIPP